jgi:hypothetical protein
MAGDGQRTWWIKRSFVSDYPSCLGVIVNSSPLESQKYLSSRKLCGNHKIMDISIFPFIIHVTVQIILNPDFWNILIFKKLGARRNGAGLSS